MTKRQAYNKAEQLRNSLQMIFDNHANRGDDRAMVVLKTAGPLDFEYNVKGKDLITFNPLLLSNEIEKMFPNVHVTESEIVFSSRSIVFICKELGQRGTYLFIFHHIKI